MRSISLLLLVLASPIASAAVGPEQSGAIKVPANEIVGLWSTEALVGFCGQTAETTVRNTLLFHAGGTLVETPLFPPSGVPDPGSGGIYQRTQGLGTWTFNPARKTYELRLRFDNFVNGVYHGYSTVDRQIVLIGTNQASGPVVVNRYLANGTRIVELCGEANSTRL
jgi:hypothetical protein